jgi:uncharacterized protein YwqG
MNTAATLEISESKTPISDYVTKFGGQPVWIDTPEWPKSRETGNPMMFIGQIAIDPQIFPNMSGKMAYLFMTSEEEYVDETWEPDGGENAVIIQPGTSDVPCDEISTGPTLESEYSVKLKFREEPNFVSESERMKNWEEAEQDEYCNALEGDKIGGTPLFIQADDFPKGEDWQLLLQLDSVTVPFDINFGDSGVGYAFINKTGTKAKFLWQCM